jgi:hypothetical protein
MVPLTQLRTSVFQRIGAQKNCLFTNLLNRNKTTLVVIKHNSRILKRQYCSQNYNSNKDIFDGCSLIYKSKNTRMIIGMNIVSAVSVLLSSIYGIYLIKNTDFTTELIDKDFSKTKLPLLILVPVIVAYWIPFIMMGKRMVTTVRCHPEKQFFIGQRYNSFLKKENFVFLKEDVTKLNVENNSLQAIYGNCTIKNNTYFLSYYDFYSVKYFNLVFGTSEV